MGGAPGRVPVTCGDSKGDADLIDLAGRIMLTHAIDPRHAMCVLGIDRPEAEDLIHAGRLWAPLGVVREGRLRLLVNILMRLEHRLHHDSGAIRHALDAPLDTLGGAAPADLLGGSLEDLRRVRGAIDAVEAPKIKWWRIGH